MRYALGRDVLRLVLAGVIGTALTGFGVVAAGDVHAGAVVVIVQNLIGVAAIVAGLVLQVGSGIGLLYKIVADATA